MKPRGFELTAINKGIERYESLDRARPSGWWINLFIGGETTLKLFFPEDHFKVRRTVGYDEDRHPIEKDVIQEPQLAPGEPVSLHVMIPLVDP